MPTPAAKSTGESGAQSASRSQAAAAAKQFEAIIIRQLLAPVMEPLMSGNPAGDKGTLGGGGASMYSYLVTDVLADSLSKGQGLGLSRMLEKQLLPPEPAGAARAYAAGGAAKAVK